MKPVEKTSSASIPLYFLTSFNSEPVKIKSFQTQATVPYWLNKTYLYDIKTYVCSWDMASVFPVDTPLFKVLYFVMVLFQFIVPAFPVIGFYTGAFPTLYFFLNEPIKPYVLKMCYTFVHQIIFPGSCILSVRTLRKKNKFQLLGISYKFVTIYFLYYRVETLPNDSNCTCIGFQPFGKKKCTCTY